MMETLSTARMRVDPRYGDHAAHGDERRGGIVTISGPEPEGGLLGRFFLDCKELEVALSFMKGTLRDLGEAGAREDAREHIASADFTPSWLTLDPDDEAADIAVHNHALESLDASILDLCARVLRGHAFVYREDAGRAMPLWQSHTAYGEGLRVYGGWASTKRSTVEAMMWRIATLEVMRRAAFTYSDVALDLLRTGRYTWPVRRRGAD